MKNLFFSQAYIDAHIEQLQSIFPWSLISDATYHNDQCASIQIKEIMLSHHSIASGSIPYSLINLSILVSCPDSFSISKIDDF